MLANTKRMTTETNTMSVSDKERLEKQRKGARVTAMIVGLVALSVFLLTLYLSAGS